MENFMILIRVDPEALTTENLSQLQQKWEPVIKRWMQDNTLINAWIFREPGYTLSGTDEILARIGYQLENGMAVTGVMEIRAMDMAEALKEARQCPTISFGGAIELRKINSFN